MLDESNTTNSEIPESPAPEEKSNRTFLIMGGVMTGLVILTLICAAIYFLVLRPRSAAQNTATQSAIETQNAQNIQKGTLTALAALWTPTLPPTAIPSRTATSIPATSTSNPTPVIAQNSPVATATTDPATLAAMQTQLALSTTSAAATAQGTRGVGGQALPTTGFFDEVGLPSMLILAAALVIVIFLARRMRKSPTK